MDDDVKNTKTQKSLHYNVVWMDRVFRSKTSVADLLSPEREAGNITPRDYEASLEFLPSYHRLYPILACIGATSLVFLRSPKKWGRAQMGMAAFTYGFTGFTAGKFLLLRAHYDYVRSLENPGGFDTAMENVKTRLGTRVPEGFIIERIYDPSSTDNAYGNQIPDEEAQLMLPGASDASPQQANQSSVQRPQTKWDQIRNANNRTANNSSWDVLRQKYEKDAAKPRKDTDSKETLWGDDVTAEDPDHPVHPQKYN